MRMGQNYPHLIGNKKDEEELNNYGHYLNDVIVYFSIGVDNFVNYNTKHDC